MPHEIIRAITPLVLFFLGVGLEIYAIQTQTQKDVQQVVTVLLTSAGALSIPVKDSNNPPKT
jgi:hypothetical protein